MISRRAPWALGSFVLAVAAVGGVLRAQDDSPESVLKANQLKRVGSTYVLAVEADVQKKLNEIRILSSQLKLAVQQQEAFEAGSSNKEAMIQELSRERLILGEQIKQLDQQINGLTIQTGNGRYVSPVGAELVEQKNQAVLTYNGYADQINLLKNTASDSRLQKKVQTEVPHQREVYLQAVLDLRQVVNSATKAYAEIDANEAVKAALATLGQKSKIKLKLGPSPQFLSNVKLLERIEKTVITDSVELHKEGGVFWVNVTFNGKVTRPMVFDTGASLTTIPSALATELGLTPNASDPVVRCETADGTVVEARQKTIPSLRVGRFTINDVVCVVMPAGKGNVAPLLGQSFHRHFTHKFTPESGHLILSKVEAAEPAQSKAVRTSKSSAKAKRTAKSKGTPTGKTSVDAGTDPDRSF